MVTMPGSLFGYVVRLFLRLTIDALRYGLRYRLTLNELSSGYGYYTCFVKRLRLRCPFRCSVFVFRVFLRLTIDDIRYGPRYRFTLNELSFGYDIRYHFLEFLNSLQRLLKLYSCLPILS